MRQHLLKISDIGGGLLGGQTGASDLLGFGEPALKADDQGEVIPGATVKSLAATLRREAIGGVPDAPAVEQRLESSDEFEPSIGRADRERPEDPVGEGAHRIVVIGERREDSDLGIGVNAPLRIEQAADIQRPTGLLR